MSTNVDHAECLSGELTITEEGKKWLSRFDGEETDQNEDESDEDETDEEESDAGEGEGEEDDWWPEVPPQIKRTDDGRDVVRMHWSGECSGHAVTYGALKKFFSFTRGTAEFVFYWEGGEWTTGYRVVDGVMVEHEVEVKLGPPVKTS
jgi:hypothetical protein